MPLSIDLWDRARNVAANGFAGNGSRWNNLMDGEQLLQHDRSTDPQDIFTLSSSPSSPPSLQVTSLSLRVKKLLGSIFLGICICGYVLQTVSAWTEKSYLNILGCYTVDASGRSLQQALLYIVLRMQSVMSDFRWFSHSCFSLLIPCSMAHLFIFQKRYSANRTSISDAYTFRSFQKLYSLYLQQLIFLFNQSSMAFLKCCLLLSLLYTLTNYLWYLALNYTSVAEVTAIFNSNWFAHSMHQLLRIWNSFFAYLFSIVFLKEPVTARRILAVFLSIFGVCAIAFQDRFHATETSIHTIDSSPVFNGGERLLGRCLSLLASMLYGLYEIMYAKFAVPKQTVNGSSSLFLANQITGFIASCIHQIRIYRSFHLLVPMAAINCSSLFRFNRQSGANFTRQLTVITGLETFELPHGRIAAFVLLNAFTSVVYNSLFMLTIVLTSPVYASIGVSPVPRSFHPSRSCWQFRWVYWWILCGCAYHWAFHFS